RPAVEEAAVFHVEKRDEDDCVFQAEDGIRDFHVTGVQTCALPISAASSATVADDARSRKIRDAVAQRLHKNRLRSLESTALTGRSEERRVGKGSRSRWAPGGGGLRQGR